MASHAPAKPIFGGAALRKMTREGETDEQTAQDVFKHLEQGGVDTLDCTYDLPGAEEHLGKMGAGGRFTINSKTPGGIVPGTSTSEGIMKHAKELASHVGAENVDVYVIHAPDPTLDIAEMCKGMNDAHKAGYFRRFGLSNFTAEQVEEVYSLCKDKGYVLPTVFEGLYNAVARKPETDLIPTLRKLGMSFYAYSPIAGGFLTKTAKQVKDGGEGSGRFGRTDFVGTMYNKIYNKTNYLSALEMWAEAAETAGCSNAELAYRWIAYDSALSNDLGDALLFGCTKCEQIPEVLAWLKKGSVGAEAKAKIEKVWELVASEAPLDNYNSAFKAFLEAGGKGPGHGAK